MFLNVFTDLLELLKKNLEAVILTLVFVAIIVVFFVVFANLRAIEKRLNIKIHILNTLLIILVLLGVRYYFYLEEKRLIESGVEEAIPLLKKILVYGFFFALYAALTVATFLRKKSETGRYSVYKITVLGLMAGLAYVLRFFGFPIIPGYPFLKLEFSGLIYILVLLWFGFGSAVIVCLLTNVLRVIFHFSPFGAFLVLGIDQLVNFIASVAYILPVAIFFFKLKENEQPNADKMLISTTVGTLITMVFMIFYNYFINLPIIYELDMPLKEAIIVFGSFNLVKWGLVTVMINLLWQKLYNLKYLYSPKHITR